tara:strand:+ start:2416 stop:2592 length:177 start_codon:yes stop_codon:yes gene_type:complete
MNNMINISKAAKILGVSLVTLRQWEKDGKISSFRTPGGHRRYDISSIEKIYKKNDKKT